jgi:glycosyltransferase involved in cell wall biosynthesis
VTRPTSLLVFNLKTDADDEALGFTTSWLRELARRYARIDVITMMVGRIAVPENVFVRSAGKERGYSRPRRIWEFYRHLESVLDSVSVEACLAHMSPHFAMLGWPLLARQGVPIVLWYAHGTVPWNLRAALPLVDRVATSSSGGFRLQSDKVRVIGQGVETDRFRPDQRAESERFTILFVGRIGPVKRIEVAIEALHRLRRDRPALNAFLRVVGSPIKGSDRLYLADLRRLASRLAIDRYVLFESGQPHGSVDGVYRAADAFVNPSETGSLDKAGLEAMSSGLPIVTSNAAFLGVLGPELGAKWVVPKRDPKAFAERLLEIAAMEPEGRRALGERLREIVIRNHGLDRLIDRLVDVIEEAKALP